MQYQSCHYEERTMKDVQPIRTRRFYRSEEGWLAGVCEGLGHSFEINPNWIRIGWVASIFFLGFGLLAYVLMALTLPMQSQWHISNRPRLLGVCYRLHHELGWDLGLIRFLTAFLAISSFGITVIGYIILHFVMPQDRRN